MLRKYVFSGDSAAVRMLFASFSENFGRSDNVDINAISRAYGVESAVVGNVGKERIVALSRTFGDVPIIVLESSSDVDGGVAVFDALLKRFGVAGEIYVGSVVVSE